MVGVLMRFREEPIALSAYIEGMYSQVLVPEYDQTVLRFLWRDDRTKRPDVYQYERHIFGATSSPTSAIYALHRAATDGRHRFPEAAQVVLDNFYMDDCLSSVNGIATAAQLQCDLVAVLAEGGFHLTKFSSNLKEVLSQIPKSELAPSLKVFEPNGTGLCLVQRVLGVRWKTDDDVFVFDVGMKFGTEHIRTPRQILSIISSVFDPLGILAPVTLVSKLIMQNLWKNKLGWDDEVPEEELDRLITWLQSLEILKDLTVPRFYRNPATTNWSTQLHMFVDSSEKAMSACGYFRFESDTGSVDCSFVIGKSRLAPIKPLTIPKLELQAAILGIRLSQSILKEHKYDVRAVHYWTDSTTVLHWIGNTSARHLTFIASKIAEIPDFSAPSQWHHVPGKLNVADDGSRGITVENLVGSSRWLNGPAFLLLSSDEWTEQPVIEKSAVCTDETEFDRPIEGYTSLAHEGSSVQHTQQHARLIDSGRFSSWNKLWRTTAYVMRFVSNCRLRHDRKHGNLSVCEKCAAETLLLKLDQGRVQQGSLFVESGHKSIAKHSSLAKLSPFLDSDGIIRSAGRIGKSDLEEAVKYPIILGCKSHITNLIIVDYHKRGHHEGINHLRNSLHQRFWIIKSRSTIRRVSRGCMLCRKRNAVPKPPMMGDLPDFRVKGHTPCFHATGIDYFGPIYVRRFRKTEKTYGCLFVCMATKAIHIEVAHSLDTSSFIQALRRFIGRRGNPKDIYSDNGTNFVGAERELRECLDHWNHEVISNDLLQRNIE
jgi:hypothetical protein